jgi:hypothetical protein
LVSRVTGRLDFRAIFALSWSLRIPVVFDHV